MSSLWHEDDAMTFEQAQEILARITYKPGWKIELVDFGFVKVSIRHKATDANDPNRTIDIRFEQGVELIHTDEKRLVDWIFICVRAAEIHEIEEWFKIDGHCFRDPHPPKASLLMAQ